MNGCTPRARPSQEHLWEHQRTALADVGDAYRAGHRAILLVLPTGAGKTRVASYFMRSHLSRAPVNRCLFLVHRIELVEQTVATLIADGVPEHAIRVVAGDATRGLEDAPIVVASTQTLLARAERPACTMLVVDEAHHYMADDWCQVVHHYRGAGVFVLGLTATPERSDGRPLGDLFTSLIAPTSIKKLTELGTLVPSTVIGPSRRKTKLAMAPDEALVQHRARWTRAIAFCASVDHAVELAQACTARGLPAAAIAGSTPDKQRADVLARFRAGELLVVTNVFVLTEGFDDTGVDGLVLARGCGSTAMFLQMIGRVIRAAAGKSGALVIDLQGAVHEHGLPDDDREYFLEGKAIRKASAQLPPIRQCADCGAVYRCGPRECPRCGATLPPPPKPKISREQLQAIHAVAPESKRRAAWDRLVAEARAKGFKMGWAAYRFKHLYGHFPNFKEAAAS